MSDLGRYWGGVYPILGDRLPRVARKLEAQGRYGILAGQNWGPPWVSLAAAAAVTERVQLACSIAIAGVRSPFETARAEIWSSGSACNSASSAMISMSDSGVSPFVGAGSEGRSDGSSWSRASSSDASKVVGCPLS